MTTTSTLLIIRTPLTDTQQDAVRADLAAEMEASDIDSILDSYAVAIEAGAVFAISTQAPHILGISIIVDDVTLDTVTVELNDSDVAFHVAMCDMAAAAIDFGSF